MNRMSFEEIRAKIESEYNVIDFNKGHYKNIGCQAYKYKNPYWTVVDSLGDTYILMYCEPETICKLCPNSLSKINEYETENHCKITWFKCGNGYIAGNNKLYIHQIIMNCYGNGRGTKNVSVDHIDQNPLNNAISNLRIATREEQEQNSKGIKEGTKRARHSSARELPEGLTHEMMPKYVYYACEHHDGAKTKFREYFRIEKHPNLDKKCWATSKSNNVSIHDKLKQAIEKLKELDSM